MKAPAFKREVESYMRLLEGTGMSDREVTRAVLYANEYGIKALSGVGCVSFDLPTCGEWNCLNPIHQQLSK